MKPAEKGEPKAEGPYTIDHLIADEKRQMRWVLLLLILALVYFGAKNHFAPSSPVEPAAQGFPGGP